MLHRNHRQFDYRHANTEWMSNQDLPDQYTLEPCLDMIAATHKFQNRLDAILFIKEWWKKDQNWTKEDTCKPANSQS